MKVSHAMTLANLTQGYIPELFEEALKRAIASIANLDSEIKNSWQAARLITVKVSLKPNPQRDYCDLRASVASSAYPFLLPVSSVLEIRRTADEAIASERFGGFDDDDDFKPSGRSPNVDLGGIALETWDDGSIDEAFRFAMSDVIANIADPNNVATNKRSLSIKVSLKSNKERNYVTVTVSVVTDVNPHSKPIECSLAIDYLGQGVLIRENTARQQELKINA